MTELFLDWLVDTMARTEVIDLYFAISDLVHIPQTELQLAENASFDALARNTANQFNSQGESHRPLGKTVL